MNQPDEILDFFDDNFKKIGSCSSSKIHAEGLWHQVIHCWIIDTKSKAIIYQQRSKSKKLYPLKLDVSVAGHCLTDEKPIDSVLREAKEELGITLDRQNLSFLGIRTFSSAQDGSINREFQHVYFYPTVVNTEVIQIDKNEVDGFTLIEPQTVISLYKSDSRYGAKIHNNNTVKDVLITKDHLIPSVDQYNLKIPLLVQRFLQNDSNILL